MRRVSYWPAMLLLLVVMGCSSKPSDEDARKAWLGKIERLGLRGVPYEPEATFQSIRKTDGVAGEAAGIKTYQYSYEVTLKCNVEHNFGFGRVKPQSCKPGELVTETGTLSFYKTENGWQPAPR